MFSRAGSEACSTTLTLHFNFAANIDAARIGANTISGILSVFWTCKIWAVKNVLLRSCGLDL